MNPNFSAELSLSEALPAFKTMEALHSEKKPLTSVPLTGQPLLMLVTVHDHDHHAEDKLLGRSLVRITWACVSTSSVCCASVLVWVGAQITRIFGSA